ncbi:MAG: DNA-processing protein DprA [Lachnospiraceae bacterium]|nr:DNA-processing protein DprA [Lachnospiraceae bacterium]
MERRDYLYFLAAMPEASPLLLRRLLSLYGDPEAVFREEKLPVSALRQEAVDEAKKRLPEILKARDEAEKAGIVWVSCEEAAYPARLAALGDAPLGIFVKGKVPPEETPSVGIIGARSCTPYGRLMAERFGGELGERGLSVISGMARGIDGVAQEAALERGGASFAVLGCGADVCYPPGNRKLYDALAEKGGLLTEYPPGTPPLPHHFPLRNRLIAALSDVLLVIEAREKSGSQITVDQALEQGREVLALPGRVGDALSAGCLKLIAQGAGVLTCCGDVYEALGMDAAKIANAAGSASGSGAPASGPSRSGGELPAPLKQIWRHMGTDPVHVEELLAAEEELTMGEISLRLLELETRGYIRQTPGGGYMKR